MMFMRLPGSTMAGGVVMLWTCHSPVLPSVRLFATRLANTIFLKRMNQF